MGTGAKSLITFTSGQSDKVQSPEDIVKEKIKFFLQTNKGDIPNDPTYGADLIQFLYAPLDADLETAIKYTIQAELGQRMPYVIVSEVSFKNYKSDGLLRFTVYYELTPGFTDSVEITVGEV